MNVMEIFNSYLYFKSFESEPLDPSILHWNYSTRLEIEMLKLTPRVPQQQILDQQSSNWSPFPYLKPGISDLQLPRTLREEDRRAPLAPIGTFFELTVKRHPGCSSTLYISSQRPVASNLGVQTQSVCSQNITPTRFYSHQMIKRSWLPNRLEHSISHSWHNISLLLWH